jgi:hypothetical protein
VNTQGKRILGRENIRCKGPEIDTWHSGGIARNFGTEAWAEVIGEGLER